MKLAIIVRKDLGMRTGKIAVQVGHASVEAYADTQHDPDSWEARNGKQWLAEGQKKIVLKVPDCATLDQLYTEAGHMGLSTHLIRDFGLTQVEPNTLTCMAVGPDTDEKIDQFTEGLSLL